MALTKIQISERLDIGPEFLFLDTFSFREGVIKEPQSDLEIAKLPSGKGAYRFVASEFTNGHFLSKQVVPASLILESILQNTAMTIYSHAGLAKGVHALIVNIQVDLKNGVLTDEAISIETRIESINRGIVLATAECSSELKIISRARLKYWYPTMYTRGTNDKE